jgi:acetyltransferase-like isoleucine patch superfamily enzyme
MILPLVAMSERGEDHTCRMSVMEKPIELPAGVIIGEGTIIKGVGPFRRYLSEKGQGLIIGRDCIMDGVQFSVGISGQITIGDKCFFTNVILMCELEIHIGNRVIIGWNSAIADSDFHPIDPALRIADAIACSPDGRGRERPMIGKKAVIIEDDVWVGPSVTILKGVRIGAGAFIEPGSMITRDVPATSRVGGNPAVIIGKAP